MNDSDFLGSGWKYPLKVQNSALQLSHGEDSIRESIMIILQTARGERVMRPTFGCSIHNYVFSPNNSTTARSLEGAVEEALLEFEPRVEVNRVRVYSNAEEESRLNIEIDYIVKSSNARGNLVYPFYLENQ